MIIPVDAHQFYAELRQDRAWWEAERDRYRGVVAEPIGEILEWASARFGGTPKQFRPVRDLRFSADKSSPYRTEAVAGLGGPGDPAVLYLRVAASGTIVGGGAPQPPREHLVALRDRIATSRVSADELQSILDGLAEAHFALPDDPLKTAPRGYSVDDPHIELLRRRSFAAEVTFPPGALASEPACERALAETWERLEPLMRWLRAAAT